MVKDPKKTKGEEIAEKEPVEEEALAGAVREARPPLQERFWSAIAYIWILCLVPFILKRGSRYVRFHAKQGVVLFIAEVILSIILIIPFIGIVAVLGWIGCIILAIRGIIEAARGNYWQMPWLGRFAKRLAI